MWVTHSGKSPTKSYILPNRSNNCMGCLAHTDRMKNEEGLCLLRLPCLKKADVAALLDGQVSNNYLMSNNFPLDLSSSPTKDTVGISIEECPSVYIVQLNRIFLLSWSIELRNNSTKISFSSLFSNAMHCCSLICH